MDEGRFGLWHKNHECTCYGMSQRECLVHGDSAISVSVSAPLPSTAPIRRSPPRSRVLREADREHERWIERAMSLLPFIGDSHPLAP